jgi:hypothetical protein
VRSEEGKEMVRGEWRERGRRRPHTCAHSPVHPSTHPLVPGVGLKRRWSWMMAMRRKVEVMQSC